MTRKFNLLSCFAATAIFVGSSALDAAVHPTPVAESPGMSELDIQVALDRAGFSSGEIDGKRGRNASQALTAFREAHGIASGARGDHSLKLALGADRLETTASHVITNQEVTGPFSVSIPEDMTERSRLSGLYYTSVLEELGETFHSAPALLQRLNPTARFAAGETIRVPNIATAARSTALTEEFHATPAALRERERHPVGHVKVVVSKRKSILTVYDDNDRIIFHAPVTSGSKHDRLPLGNWVITAVIRHPSYQYNPNLFWDANQANARATIAAGPNNPVGDVWIDLNKPHYGIHGTPEPARIGYAESHGCVRLTNWDAWELAALVSKGTPVVFVR
jgi:lipoprotein-anchoring transpeptidase ErfK/SrfK